MKAGKTFNGCVLVLIVLFSQQLLIAKAGKTTKTIAQPTILHYTQFDANNICSWIGNTGEVVSYNVTGNAGLEWPKGSGLTAIFQSGIWIAGLVDGQIRSAAAEYTSEYQPGNVSYNPDAQNPEAGIPNDPNLARFNIYTINKGDSPDPSKVNYNPDYANWPVADGAPAHDGEYFTDSNENGIYDSGEEFEDFDMDGVYDAPDGQLIEGEDPALLLGDQTHWSVSNDFGPEHGNLFYTDPLGIELQTTIFGFESNYLDDVMFVKWLLINKSGKPIDDCYNAIWSDPDVGDATDDYVGCDTTLSVGYAYNGNEIDQTYGYAVPCVGYDYFQGPVIPSMGDTAYVSGEKIPDFKNLPMTSFAAYGSSTNDFPDPRSAEQAYNYMRGLKYDGSVWTDPTGNPSSFVFTGDPLTGNGWIASDDFNPGDKRFLMSSGPFTMETWTDENDDERAQVGEPGVQEIVMAIIIGAGSNHLNSIAVMKDLSREAYTFYRYGENRPKITVTEPNGGEVFSTEIPVQWLNDPAHPTATSVIIQMSTDGGYIWDSIDTLNSNPGQYSIDVSDHPDAVFGKVRVIGRIDDRQLCLAPSDGTFIIDNPAVNSAPVIDPIQPFYGHKQTISGDFPIRWNIQDADDTELRVTLELKNRLEDWRPIADGLENTVQFIWQSQYYPNSTTTYLRLIASDGTNQTITEIPYQFILSNDRKTISPVDHTSGHAKAMVEVGIVDQSKMNQHQYKITFQEGDTVFHSVKDITSGQWIFENLPLFGPADESPVFDGIALAITHDEAINFNPSLSGWISGECNWYVSVVIEGLRYTSYQYEIRFTDEGSVDVNGIAVPFEVWNTDLDYSPSLYVQVANDQKYNFGIYEHFGENDSAIVWVVDISAPTDKPSSPPQSGDIYLVFITTPLTNEDVYQFTNEYISDIVEDPPLPIRFSLQQNYPNPFNPTTTIIYNLPKPAFTEINIYNLAGQLVQTLLNEVKPAGRHQIIWDAGDLPSGIYLYQIKVVDFQQTRKCILLK